VSPQLLRRCRRCVATRNLSVVTTWTRISTCPTPATGSPFCAGSRPFPWARYRYWERRFFTQGGCMSGE
jgi:hypothetical protein